MPDSKATIFYTTKFGRIVHGNSCDFLQNELQPASVDLIMTSPPFGLVRKKGYGNVDSEAYVDWFRPFAKAFKVVVKQNGSLVIELGASKSQCGQSDA